MKICLLPICVAALIAPVPAQPRTLAETIAAMPKGLVRAKGPTLESSMAAARAAVDSCAASGHNVSALIVDSEGNPVVLLSGDGAGVRSQLIARTKTNTVIKYHMSSLAVAEKVRSDPKLAAEIAADPEIGMARGGGVPVIVNGEWLGAFAVSGAFGPDEACVDAALAKVNLH